MDRGKESNIAMITAIPKYAKLPLYPEQLAAFLTLYGEGRFGTYISFLRMECACFPAYQAVEQNVLVGVSWKEGIFNGTCVHPLFRGMGIGEALLRLKVADYPEHTAQVEEWNGASRKLCQKVGVPVDLIYPSSEES